MAMKNALTIICLSLVCTVKASELAEEFTIDVRPQQYAKTQFLIGCIGENVLLDRCAQALQNDLVRSGQFEVLAERYAQVPSKIQFQLMAQRGYQLALFLSSAEGSNAIEWRLYNTKNPTMLVGKRYVKKSSESRVWAHDIATLIWPVLTGQQGSFSSRIAYCKRIAGTRKRPINHICIADIDGSYEQVLVTTPTVKFSPRWNRDKTNPLIFYTECRQANNMLAYVAMDGKRFIASNYDGNNMLLSFAADGNQAVYCSSLGQGNCQLFYCSQGGCKQITHNTGNNFSPTFSADGSTIYFCSDFGRNNPAIRSYDVTTGAIKDVIADGYCVSPACNLSGDKLAYAKMVHGTLQIFVYDIKNRQHEQLTFDAGDKEECSWSPCGNYLLYSVSKGDHNRVAVLNTITKRQHWITAASDDCSYPCWSPMYDNYPLVTACAQHAAVKIQNRI